MIKHQDNINIEETPMKIKRNGIEEEQEINLLQPLIKDTEERKRRKIKRWWMLGLYLMTTITLLILAMNHDPLKSKIQTYFEIKQQCNDYCNNLGEKVTDFGIQYYYSAAQLLLDGGQPIQGKEEYIYKVCLCNQKKHLLNMIGEHGT